MTCENYICLPELGGVSLEESSLVIQPSAPSKSSHTAKKCLEPAKETESYQNSQSSETSKNSTVNLGAEKLTSLREDSLAKTSRQQIQTGKESKGPGLDSGKKWPESFVKLDRNSHSWKTHQQSLFEDWEPFFLTWPQWGCMHDGECWELETSELGIGVPGFGCWLPTPVATEHKGSSRARFLGSPEYRGSKMSEGLRTCKNDPIYLHPNFAEHTMGWPIMWTELEPLEMVKFQRWQQQHSAFYRKD